MLVKPWDCDVSKLRVLWLAILKHFWDPGSDLKLTSEGLRRIPLKVRAISAKINY